MRVGENFAAGRGIERAAVGILEARVGVERGFFSAASVIDTLGAGKRIDIFVVEIERGLRSSRVSACIRNAGEWIFSEVILASSRAEDNMRSMPLAAEKSLEYVEAARCP